MNDDLERNGRPKNGTGLAVEMYHYVNRVVADLKDLFGTHNQGHNQRHLDEDRAVELRTVAVEREFQDHRRTHDDRHRTDQEAIKQQRETNELRFRTITGDYVTKEQFETFQAAEQAKRRTLYYALAGLVVPVAALIIGALG